MYWPGREGTGFWVECRSERTVMQGQCGRADDGSYKIFSAQYSRCAAYSEIVSEICQWTGGLIPHEKDCHRYYDCSFHDPAMPQGSPLAYLVTCPYPQLFSVHSRKCEDYKLVSCGPRTEVKTPCEWM
ncbi:uncharacterized protein LOC106011655, partial [Aplysia californica]|uniref:Uncharacterized protein LOC106011655 n=1 Tax=Aplysia californica TaxID=6500 RepID=A0ABM0ZZ49_APLCA